MQQNVGRHQIKGKFVIVFIGKKGIKIHVEFIDSKLNQLIFNVVWYLIIIHFYLLSAETISYKFCDSIIELKFRIYEVGSPIQNKILNKKPDERQIFWFFCFWSENYNQRLLYVTHQCHQINR